MRFLELLWIEMISNINARRSLPLYLGIVLVMLIALEALVFGALT